MFRFDNRFIRAFLPDPHTTADVRPVRAAYAKIHPTRVPKPHILGWSTSLAAHLGLPGVPTTEWEQLLSGNTLLEGMVPYAASYGGHQFGNWAGQLGDGRAITLAELIAPDESRWEIQLKGPGPTPFSRRADGRAVLRSSLREFVCSEAMHHLGVPTTRALALVSTGELVERDMFYDGRAQLEPGAITTRVAPSFLRFGTYELPASRKDEGLLRQLVDYTLETHFPHLTPSSPSSVVAFFNEVARRSAFLAIEWQRVGFVHGVMNTDNMSILGLTLDYGPYGWLEGFDPTWTPNTTDLPGRRYCYANQPAVVQWNLMCLANALFPLVGEEKPFEEVLEAYSPVADAMLLEAMRKKLGLAPRAGKEAADRTLMLHLFQTLTLTETDMTLFFRRLAQLSPSMLEGPEDSMLEPLFEAWYAPAELVGEVRGEWLRWLRLWLGRLKEDGADDVRRADSMNSVNPLYVPRNYLAQTVIDSVSHGETDSLAEWMKVLTRPYEEQPGMHEWAQKRPEWARHRPGSSTLSCSS